MKEYLTVGMPDGTKWQIPVMAIALNHAECFMEEYDNDLAKSLIENTIPLFEQDQDEIIDWADNNMTWEEVCNVARKTEDFKDPDYNEGWEESEKYFE